MANTTGWVAGRGVGLTWTSAGFTATDFNSLANGSTVVASSALNNATALDLYADVSFSLVVGGTTVTNSFFALYILPLNQDGTSYGDGSVTGTTAPASGYQVSAIAPRNGIASGTAATGMFRTVVLPPGSFKFAVGNNLTVALNAAAAAVVSYRTYDENLNA